MDPKNLYLHRIDLPEFGLGTLLCSLDKEDLLSCFQSNEHVFDENRRLTVDCDLREPTKGFSSRLLDEVFKHFCTGTYWFFGGVLLKLERDEAIDEGDYIQLLAVLATLHDPNSNPVVLYPVNSLV